MYANTLSLSPVPGRRPPAAGPGRAMAAPWPSAAAIRRHGSDASDVNPTGGTSAQWPMAPLEPDSLHYRYLTDMKLIQPVKKIFLFFHFIFFWFFVLFSISILELDWILVGGSVGGSGGWEEEYNCLLMKLFK